MSDTDEIRSALSDALRLPGEVHARPGAASTIRARARSRRRTAVATIALGVPAGLVIVALLVTNGSGPRAASPPATKTSTTPSPSGALPAPAISVRPGPRTLATPIEIRPMLREYLTCPAHPQTVPAFEGPRCYRLGPAALVIRRVRDLSTGLSQSAVGAGTDGIAVNLTMTARDAATVSALTAASLHKRVAFVLNGKVRVAPSIEGHITDGQIQIPVDGLLAQALVTELTG